MSKAGINLKKAREERGLQVEDVSAYLDIQKEEYKVYESGEKKPDFNTLKKISGFFDIPIDILMGKEETGKTEKIEGELEPEAELAPAQEKSELGQEILNLGLKSEQEVQEVTIGDVVSEETSKGRRKKDKKKKRSKKNKKGNRRNEKVAVLKVGTRKKSVICLWILLVSSLAFGIYKNFTAIDIRTIEQTEIVEKRVEDTNKVENFVEDFARVYYAWSDDEESIAKRTESLKNYLTEELQNLNADMIKADEPNSSEIKSFRIWDIEQVEDNEYKVIYKVKQLITQTTTAVVQETQTEMILDEASGQEVPVETKVEKEVKDTTEDTVESVYAVIVYVDENGNMIITGNPTVSSLPAKSEYEPEAAQSDGTIEAEKSDEITEFLEVFFAMYPTADEKELAYYVKDNAMLPIEREYAFSEINSYTYTAKKDQVVADVTVTYLDKETGAIQHSQFELTLEKGENWMIVDATP